MDKGKYGINIKFSITIMIFFNNLPSEINDRIFLCLDWSELVNIREIQSDYVKQITKYNGLINTLENGNFDNIKWVCKQLNGFGYFSKNMYRFDEWLYKNAIQCVNLNILDNINFLIKESYSWRELILRFMIYYGKLINIEWLLKNGCLWNERSFGHAVERGNLDKMKWFFENGYLWNDYTFKMAIIHGDLINIKWLYENGYPYSRWSFKRVYEWQVESWIKENIVDIENLEVECIF